VSDRQTDGRISRRWLRRAMRCAVARKNLKNLGYFWINFPALAAAAAAVSIRGRGLKCSELKSLVSVVWSSLDERSHFTRFVCVCWNG